MNSDGLVHCRTSELNLPIRIAFTLAVVFVLASLVNQRIGPGMASLSWDKFAVLSRQAKFEEMTNITQVNSVVTQRLDSVRMDRELRKQLRNVLRWNPNDARACLHLSSIDLRLFELEQNVVTSGMPLSQIREVLQTTQFDSPEERDEWLSQILGDRRGLVKESLACSNRSLRLSPCNGNAYVYFADAALFQGLQSEHRAALFEQANRVRPFDGIVLYKTGVESMNQGDLDSAMEIWHQAFYYSSDVRSVAMQSLAPVFSAEKLSELVKNDIDCLDQLYQIFISRNERESARYIAPQLVEAIEQRAKQSQSFEDWHYSAEIHSFLGDHVAAVRCEKSAVKRNFNDFALRIRLADYLMATNQFEDAVRELKWCTRRKPDDPRAAAKLKEAYRQQIVAAGHTRETLR